MFTKKIKILAYKKNTKGVRKKFYLNISHLFFDVNDI